MLVALGDKSEEKYVQFNELGIVLSTFSSMGDLYRSYSGVPVFRENEPMNPDEFFPDELLDM